MVKKIAPTERLYRRHWWYLIDKIFLGLFGLAIVGGLSWLTGWLWLLAVGLIPLGWLSLQVVRWRSQYLYFENRRLVFHRWPNDLGEHINFVFVDWKFDQRNLWAELWNYGTLRVGTHAFEQFWPFRQLANAVKISLQAAPGPAQPAAAPPPPVGIPAQPATAGQPYFVFIPIRERVVVRERIVEKSRSEPPTLPPWEGDGYIYRDIPFEVDHPSYFGFLAACEEFLLPVGHLSLAVWVSQDPRRRYYRRGMAHEVALFYRELLQRAHIIDDQDRLFSRIRTIEDISQRVPYFEVPRRLIYSP